MITLRSPLVPDSGDVSQVNTSQLANNTLFWDTSLGLLRWNLSTSEWKPAFTSTPLAPTIRTNSDLNYDGSEYYLEIDCNGVLSAMINGVSAGMWVTQAFTPNRIYGIANNSPATYTLYLA